MNELIEPVLADPNLLAAAAFVLTLLLCAVGFLVAVPDSATRRLQRRVARITRPPEAPPVDLEEEAQARVESVRREEGGHRLVGLNRALRRVLPNSAQLRLRLERAGWSISILEYMLAGLGLGVAAALALLLLYGVHVLIALFAGIAVGVGLPHLVLGRAIQRRLRRFTLQLPDAIELIVRGIKSGLPVSEAINAIGQEMDDPIGSEFRNISSQLHIGVELDDALWNVARRLDHQEFKFFVISLSIQRETGGNLAEVLENLATLIRRREQVRLKIKAMSSEARASAMIIGSLPFIMAILLYIVNREYIMTLIIDPRGWILLGIGGAMMLVGIAIMARMIRFEI